MDNTRKYYPSHVNIDSYTGHAIPYIDVLIWCCYIANISTMLYACMSSTMLLAVVSEFGTVAYVCCFGIWAFWNCWLR